MSAKTSADVLIGGKIYTLSGYESEAYLQKVAAYINNKAGEFDEIPDYRRFSADMKATLLELNIADDYFKAKRQGAALEQDVEQKDKEMYDLKHELISTQIKCEGLEQELEKLKEEKQQLQMRIVKMEVEMKNRMR